MASTRRLEEQPAGRRAARAATRTGVEPAERQRISAELLGTFLLTFVAAGADVVEGTSGGAIGHVARYVAPALLVTAMIWSMSAISGAHINPAVTWAFLLRRCFEPRRIPGYMLAQLTGAVLAALLLRAIFGGAAVSLGVTHPSAGFGAPQAFATETLLTFVLVYVILATAEEEAVVGKNSALAVGGVIALAGLAFSPLSGASMNPARSLGPMIVAGDLGQAWVYLLAPLLGALLAVGGVEVIHGAPNRSTRDAAGGKRK